MTAATVRRAAAYIAWALSAFLMGQGAARAGPPYLSDDPEPTDYRHFEIYAFANGVTSAAGSAGESGIDFNYGGAPDLQLTAVLPLAYDERARTALGNIELAAKYRFLHQESDGLDVSVFPRLFFPSGLKGLGNDHASFLLPVWVERDFGKWSVFGGGGCVLNRGGRSRNFCLGGATVTRQILEGLRLGVELFHEGADAAGGKAATILGGGLTYDMSDNYHFLAYWGPGLQNTSEVGRANWYTALLFTF